jgi:hypothetical protein
MSREAPAGQQQVPLCLTFAFKTRSCYVARLTWTSGPLSLSLSLSLSFGGMGFELRASCLLGKVRYHLSHNPSSFCSGYFRNGVSLLAQDGLDHGVPILSFLPLLG